MSVGEEQSRRRGGREARKALRARVVPINEGAVRPGMEGGQYKPLTNCRTLSINTKKMCTIFFTTFQYMD